MPDGGYTTVGSDDALNPTEERGMSRGALVVFVLGCAVSLVAFGFVVRSIRL